MAYSDSSCSFPRSKWRKSVSCLFLRFFGICILSVAASFGSHNFAHAEERLNFLPYPYGMNPPPNVLELFEKEFGYEDLKGQYKELVLGVPFDIDLDGKLELAVALVTSGTCGSVGCSGLVLQGSNADGWNILVGVYTGFDRIIVSKDTVNGYRVLIEPTVIRVWNGVRFFSVCTQDECRRTFNQGVDF